MSESGAMTVTALSALLIVYASSRSAADEVGPAPFERSAVVVLPCPSADAAVKAISVVGSCRPQTHRLQFLIVLAEKFTADDIDRVREAASQASKDGLRINLAHSQTHSQKITKPPNVAVLDFVLLRPIANTPDEQTQVWLDDHFLGYGLGARVRALDLIRQSRPNVVCIRRFQPRPKDADDSLGDISLSGCFKELARLYETGSGFLCATFAGDNLDGTEYVEGLAETIGDQRPAPKSP